MHFASLKFRKAFLAVKRVVLGNHHRRPGRTRHSINGNEFPPFVSLEIAQYPGNSGFYLLHIVANGATADTHHECIEEAMHQAEFEFGVQSNEWVSATS